MLLMSFPAGKVAVHLPRLKSAPVTGGSSPIAGAPITDPFSAAAMSEDDEDIADGKIFFDYRSCETSHDRHLRELQPAQLQIPNPPRCRHNFNEMISGRHTILNLDDLL